jgi:hypothetical protein
MRITRDIYKLAHPTYISQAAGSAIFAILLLFAIGLIYYYLRS